MGDVIAFQGRSAPVATHEDKQRLIRLLIRDIADEMGRGAEFVAKFGRLAPQARDARLRASANGFA